ncbi:MULTISPECIES: alpha/beta hydrolase family protein [unclassified Arcicella]|uniref:alpha/beta hydrolase n=1 Tax=unclassified Arcicella TaxID=2644986 RepID=UPI0028552D31|nr:MULTISPECIES: alpha/beta hydrolase family protein [unclassified Arcicella]MDR6562406.1 S-formylglutathione hydrolase FrmB [Arcicella sp. BE51]MDR6812300.1 S-formylglutathione hydrolase FrmB [Arcicella sp. BE140]MDR6823631.1 S-formylglutathione hydrolase FrmB [Arcicella sp. BE139]
MKNAVIILLVFACTFFAQKVQAAVTDTLAIQSLAMNKTLKAVVITPQSYQSSKKNYPVVYLLHGGSGNYKNWTELTPDKSLVARMADLFDVIIVMPDGGTSSYYFDSPLLRDSQYETFISKEVREKVDKDYRTIKTREGRAITGLSMGGHGAVYIATKHPDLYCAAGSMSGVLNINPSTWKVTPDFAKIRIDNFKKMIGEREESGPFYPGFNLITMTEQIKAAKLHLIFDCGVDDFLIEPNREMHKLLTANGTPHDYTERPGKHEWPYWENALPYHLLFFQKVLQAKKQ